MKRKMSMDEMLTRYFPTIADNELEAMGQRVFSRLQAEMQKHDTSLLSLYGDGWNAEPVDQREFQVLSAAGLLGSQGTAVSIARIVEKWIAGDMLMEVLLTLPRLQKRKLIKRHRSASSESLDDGMRYRYELSEAGSRALARARAEGMELSAAREGYETGGCTETSR